MHKIACERLQTSLIGFIGSEGEALVEGLERQARLLLVWLDLLEHHASQRNAPELLVAARAAIREAAALCAIGAVRPCLFSLRAQIDLVLGWMYFKDHPVEYSLVKRTGDGFVLKKEALKYLHEYYDGFGQKLAVLDQQLHRAEADPYRLLSAHIHSQSVHVIPKVGELRDIVASRDLANECLALQQDVSEYISDIFFAAGLIAVDSLPLEITNSVKARGFSAAQKALLFA